jgi:integration host factor subunit alpha
MERGGVMTLTKKDIVDKIFLETNFSRKEAIYLVERIFQIMKNILSRGEHIKIAGLGNFTVRDKKVRLGRNPKTGTPINISARRVLTFHPSVMLKKDINSKFAHRLKDDGSEDTSLEPMVGSRNALETFS